MKNTNEIKLLIFDMDGTIIDSENLNYYSYSKALSEIGIILNREFFDMNCCNGRHYSKFLNLLMPSLGEDDMKNVHSRKQKIYKDNLDMLKVNPFIIEIIKCNKNKKKLSLATTASKASSYEAIKHVGLDGFFDLILTGEDVIKRKPFPDIFIKSMEYFNVSTIDTVIFEDSDIGIEAAVKSGAWIFKVCQWVRK